MNAQARIEDGKPPRLRPGQLTVVTPVYRNADTLAELAQRLHAALDAKVPDHRVLLVDDNSPDESWQILEGLCRADDRLAAVKLSANFGQHRALLTGLALAADSAWVAALDADLQDPPEVLCELYEKALATGRTVFAERHGKYESSGRMLTSLLFKSLVGQISGLPRRCGTFFIAPQPVVARLLDFSVPVPQVPIMTRIAAGQIATVPFIRPTRPHGESAYNFGLRLRVARDGLRCAVACRLAKGGGQPASNPAASRISARLGRGWTE
ncbi:glycosyltransferase [Methylomagnum sp.]